MAQKLGSFPASPRSDSNLALSPTHSGILPGQITNLTNNLSDITKPSTDPIKVSVISRSPTDVCKDNPFETIPNNSRKQTNPISQSSFNGLSASQIPQPKFNPPKIDIPGLATTTTNNNIIGFKVTEGYFDAIYNNDTKQNMYSYAPSMINYNYNYSDLLNYNIQNNRVSNINVGVTNNIINSNNNNNISVVTPSTLNVSKISTIKDINNKQESADHGTSYQEKIFKNFLNDDEDEESSVDSDNSSHSERSGRTETQTRSIKNSSRKSSRQSSRITTSRHESNLSKSAFGGLDVPNHAKFSYRSKSPTAPTINEESERLSNLDTPATVIAIDDDDVDDINNNNNTDSEMYEISEISEKQKSKRQSVTSVIVRHEKFDSTSIAADAAGRPRTTTEEAIGIMSGIVAKMPLTLINESTVNTSDEDDKDIKIIEQQTGQNIGQISEGLDVITDLQNNVYMVVDNDNVSVNESERIDYNIGKDKDKQISKSVNSEEMMNNVLHLVNISQSYGINGNIGSSGHKVKNSASLSVVRRKSLIVSIQADHMSNGSVSGKKYSDRTGGVGVMDGIEEESDIDNNGSNVSYYTPSVDIFESENASNIKMVDIREWTYKDVCGWLKNQLLQDSEVSIDVMHKILVKFELNYVAGHVLLVLDQELLEAMGIDKQNIQNKILNLTKQLKSGKRRC